MAGRTPHRLALTALPCIGQEVRRTGRSEFEPCGWPQVRLVGWFLGVVGCVLVVSRYLSAVGRTAQPAGRKVGPVVGWVGRDLWTSWPCGRGRPGGVVACLIVSCRGGLLYVCTYVYESYREYTRPGFLAWRLRLRRSVVWWAGRAGKSRPTFRTWEEGPMELEGGSVARRKAGRGEVSMHVCASGAD